MDAGARRPPPVPAPGATVRLVGVAPGAPEGGQAVAAAEVDARALEAALPGSQVAHWLQQLRVGALAPDGPVPQVLLPARAAPLVAWVAAVAAAPSGGPPPLPPPEWLEEARELSFGFFGPRLEAATAAASIAALRPDTALQALLWAAARRHGSPADAGALWRAAAALMAAHLPQCVSPATLAALPAADRQALHLALGWALQARLQADPATGLDGHGAALRLWLPAAELAEVLALPPGRLGAWALGQPEDAGLPAFLEAQVARLLEAPAGPPPPLLAACGLASPVPHAVGAALQLRAGGQDLQPQLAAGRLVALDRLVALHAAAQPPPAAAAGWRPAGAFWVDDCVAAALRRGDVAWLQALADAHVDPRRSLRLMGLGDALGRAREGGGLHWRAARWLHDPRPLLTRPEPERLRRACLGLGPQVTPRGLARSLSGAGTLHAELAAQLLDYLQMNTPQAVPDVVQRLQAQAQAHGYAATLGLLHRGGATGIDWHDAACNALAHGDEAAHLSLRQHPAAGPAPAPEAALILARAARADSPAGIALALRQLASDPPLRRAAVRDAFEQASVFPDAGGDAAVAALAPHLEPDAAFVHHWRDMLLMNEELPSAVAVDDLADDEEQEDVEELSSLNSLCACLTAHPVATAALHAEQFAPLARGLALQALALEAGAAQYAASIGRLAAWIAACGVPAGYAPSDADAPEEVLAALLLAEGPAAAAAAGALAAHLQPRQVALAHVRALHSAAALDWPARHAAVATALVAGRHLAHLERLWPLRHALQRSCAAGLVAPLLDLHAGLSAAELARLAAA